MSNDPVKCPEIDWPTEWRFHDHITRTKGNLNYWRYTFAGQILAARQTDHAIDNSDVSEAVEFADLLLAELEKDK